MRMKLFYTPELRTLLQEQLLPPDSRLLLTAFKAFPTRNPTVSLLLQCSHSEPPAKASSKIKLRNNCSFDKSLKLYSMQTGHLYISQN